MLDLPSSHRGAFYDVIEDKPDGTQNVIVGSGQHQLLQGPQAAAYATFLAPGEPGPPRDEGPAYAVPAGQGRALGARRGCPAATPTRSGAAARMAR